MADVYSNEAPALDLKIAQGATFTLGPMTWKDSAGALINLTGYVARMKFRASADASTVLYDASALVTLGGAAGTITVTLSDAITAAFTWQTAVYDLEVQSGGGAVTRLLQGNVLVSREVTR